MCAERGAYSGYNHKYYTHTIENPEVYICDKPHQLLLALRRFLRCRDLDLSIALVYLWLLRSLLPAPSGRLLSLPLGRFLRREGEQATDSAGRVRPA